MTHQFAFVPLLMIGAITSQAVSRALCRVNFYSEIIERDGVGLEKLMPALSFASLQNRPVSTIANFSPVFAESTSRAELERLCSETSYQQFPVVIDGKLLGTISREAISSGNGSTIDVKPAETISARSTIKQAVAQMVEKSVSHLVIVSASENTPIGIVTLHDILRLQNQLSDLQT
jgi:CIC family chloride channel protein